MNIVQKIVEGILGLLPDSPFTNVIVTIGKSDIWGYLNYFVPISWMLGVTKAWVAVMASYYAWGFIRKWIEKLAN